MSDKLNQIGRNIGKTKKQDEFLLTRIGQRFPLIERSKDTFNGAFPFLMEFLTEVEENNISLDLYFNPSYNFTDTCEKFNLCEEEIVEEEEVPCNTTDSMGRTQAIGWGLSDIQGLGWDAGEINDSFSITPGHAVYDGPGFSGFAAIELLLQANYATTTPTEVLAQFTFPASVGTSTVAMTFYLKGPSRIYALDMYRVGNNLDVEPYARHGGSYDFPGYVSNVLTSIVGVPFNVRLRIESPTVTWKIWKASDPEPSTWTLTANPPSSLENTYGNSINDVVFQYQSSGITSEVNSFAFVEGYISCGEWVGGTETTDYYIANKVLSSHSADARYHQIQVRRWSALSGYDFTNTSPFRKQTANANFVQFGWFALGGGNVKSVKVNADQFYGLWNLSVSPNVSIPISPEIMQVAAWIGGSPLHDQPPDFFFPLDTVLDISNYGGGISIQPWVGNSLVPHGTSFPIPDVSAGERDMFWTGGEGLYLGGIGSAPPAQLQSTSTYEPFVIEVVTITGAVWTAGTTTIPTPPPTIIDDGSCISTDGIVQFLNSYVAGSTVVKFNSSLLVRGTDYEETNPAAGIITIAENYRTENKLDTVIVCYVIDIITDLPSLFYPINVKVWLNNTDITYWVFGIETLNPNDVTNTWRNVDISNYIKGSARHKLKVTTTSAGEVEARVKIR